MMPKKPNETPSASSLADIVVASVNKQMGQPVARRLGGGVLAADVRAYISTRSAVLDYAIGKPGIPTGRMTLIVGGEGAGKSTLVYELIAETQQRGGLAILADAESRYDRDRAERIGIDPEQLVILDTSNLESIIRQIDIVVDVARKEAPDDLILVVWDSVAATPTKNEIEAEFGEIRVGEHAKQISQVMRRWANRMAQNNVAIVVVNQLREALRFFDPTPGGAKTMIAEHPLGYHSSLIIEVTRVKNEGDKEAPDAILSRFIIRKNTIAPPFRRAFTVIRFDNGFDRVDAKLRLCEQLGWVTKSSSWYSYHPEGGEEVKFQRGSFGEVLAGHPEIDDAINTTLGYVDES
jgi:recombination protein RecA